MQAEIFKDATTKAVRTLSHKGDEIAVIFAGTGAAAGPETIILPALVNGAHMEDEEAEVMRGFADHETLHHRLSGLHDKQVINAILALTKKQHFISNALEDMRIEQIGVQLYPGMRRSLAAVGNFTAARSSQAIPDDAWSNVYQLGALAVTWLGRIRMGTDKGAARANWDKCSPEVQRFAEKALGLLDTEVERCVKDGKINKAATKRAALQVIELGKRLAAEVKKPKPAPQPQPSPPQDDQEYDDQQDDYSLPCKDDEEDEPQDCGDQGNTGQQDNDAGTVENDDAELDDNQWRDDADPARRGDVDGADDDDPQDDDGMGGGGGGDEHHDNPQDKHDNGDPNRSGQGGGHQYSNPNGGDGDDEEDNGDDDMLDAEVDDAVQDMAKDINDRNRANDDGTRRAVRITTGMDTAHSRREPGSGGVATIFTRDEYDNDYLTRLMYGITSEQATIKRKLERALMAEDRREYVAGQRSGRLNSARVADVMRGKSNVFRRAETGYDMDTAIDVLIDMSGSMKDSRIKLACQAAVMLIEAMDRVGAKVAVHGFASGIINNPGVGQMHFGVRTTDQEKQEIWNTANTMLQAGTRCAWYSFHSVEIKGWRDKVIDGKVALARLGINQPFNGWTPVAQGIRTSWLGLMNRTEKRKIMLVITDGEPNTGDMPESSCCDDARQAIADARKAGIDVVSIGIEQETKHLFGEEWSHYIHHAGQLAKTCLDVIGKALLGAAERRAA